MDIEILEVTAGVVLAPSATAFDEVPRQEGADPRHHDVQGDLPDH
jgi:hypothetical protein